MKIIINPDITAKREQLLLCISDILTEMRC